MAAISSLMILQTYVSTYNKNSHFEKNNFYKEAILNNWHHATEFFISCLMICFMPVFALWFYSE